MDSRQYGRIVFLPVAIRTGQTEGSTSLGLQMPTAGRASWALDELTSMPVHFREEIESYDESTLARMLAELDQRLMPFQSRAAARAEFKSLMQGEKEGLQEFSRRIRSLGDLTNRSMDEQARDDMNCELLLREEIESFVQAIIRAQSLELAKKNVGARSGRWPYYIRELHGAFEFMSGSSSND